MNDFFAELREVFPRSRKSTYACVTVFIDYNLTVGISVGIDKDTRIFIITLFISILQYNVQRILINYYVYARSKDSFREKGRVIYIWCQIVRDNKELHKKSKSKIKPIKKKELVKFNELLVLPFLTDIIELDLENFHEYRQKKAGQSELFLNNIRKKGD